MGFKKARMLVETRTVKLSHEVSVENRILLASGLQPTDVKQILLRSAHFLKFGVRNSSKSCTNLLSEEICETS